MSESRILWLLCSPQKCLDEWHMFKKKWTIFLERTYCCRNEPVLKTALLYSLQQSGQLGHVWRRPLTLNWAPAMNISLHPFNIRTLLRFPLISLLMSNYAFSFFKTLQVYDSQHSYPNSPHSPLTSSHCSLHPAICRFQSDFIIYAFAMYHNTTYTHTQSHDSSFLH